MASALGPFRIPRNFAPVFVVLLLHEANHWAISAGYQPIRSPLFTAVLKANQKHRLCFLRFHGCGDIIQHCVPPIFKVVSVFVGLISLFITMAYTSIAYRFL